MTYKRAANNREILNKSLRDTTPEQLEGMNGGGFNRFNLDAYHSEDSSSESGSSNTNPSKKIKSQDVKEHSVPQWSNPDPYTVLPPPETLGAPKKDIVQVIRKAKIDSSKKATGGDATEEADFISFDFANDDELGEPSLLSGDDLGGRITSHDEAQLARAEQTWLGSSDQAYISEKAATANLVAATQSNKRKRGPGGPTGKVLDSWYSSGPNKAPWCSPSLSLALNPALRFVIHFQLVLLYPR